MDTIKRLTHWFRGSKQSRQTSSDSSQISSSFRSGFYDPDSSSTRTPIRFSPRQVKRPRQCTIDKEYNVVLVPSDGECMSESDSDGSDWSIGWLEPHGSGFEPGQHQKDSSFAVLVPLLQNRYHPAKGGLLQQAFKCGAQCQDCLCWGTKRCPSPVRAPNWCPPSGCARHSQRAKATLNSGFLLFLTRIAMMITFSNKI